MSYKLVCSSLDELRQLSLDRVKDVDDDTPLSKYFDHVKMLLQQVSCTFFEIIFLTL